MKKMISCVILSVAFFSGVALACAQKAVSVVDTSNDGIFTALTTSKNLQSTIDKLIAHGANHHSVIAIAAAAGIPQRKIMKLQVCVNAVSPDSTTLSATCMRQQTLLTAYESGANDPLNFLPATAAGKRDPKAKK